jgi:uncharacterized protein YjbJ (UPF0337 family)
MNWDQIEGKWKQLKGSAKQQFGKLTDDDLEQISGKRDILVGKLQERYGIVKEQAQKEADEWYATANPPSTSEQKPEHKKAAAQANAPATPGTGQRTGQHTR